MTKRESKTPGSIRVSLPRWAQGLGKTLLPSRTDEEKMRLAIFLARENVRQGTGGPFGAAVFQQPANQLVSLGVNSVERLNNAALHAEMMALMFAQARVGSYTLSAPGLPAHELIASCEPCAMCLGAALWSGVKRIVCGALRSDAMALGFDEGPVFPASHRYLEARGVEIVCGVLTEEAREVFELYRERNGLVYNG
jgi:tRNA(Arg) A34 adenosine deaminase TadA